MSRRDRLNALKSMIDTTSELNKHDAAAETTMIASHTGTRIRRGVEEKDGHFVTDTRDIVVPKSILVSEDEESSDDDEKGDGDDSTIDLENGDAAALPQSAQKRKPPVDPLALQLAAYSDATLEKAQLVHAHRTKKHTPADPNDTKYSSSSISKTYEKRVSKARELTAGMVQIGMDQAEDEDPYQSAQDADFNTLVQLESINARQNEQRGEISERVGFSDAVYNQAAVAEISHELNVQKQRQKEKTMMRDLSKRNGALSGVNNSHNDVYNVRLAKDYKSAELTAIRQALEYKTHGQK